MVAQCCECTKNHWIVFSQLKESNVCKLYRIKALVKEKFPCSAWLGEVLRKLWNTIKWYLADKMHIEGTPNTHEMSKHYSFFWFFFFFLEHPLCTNRQNRVTWGDGSSNKLITLPRKKFTAVRLKLLLPGLKFCPSFPFGAFISLCVCIGISPYVAPIFLNPPHVFMSQFHHQSTAGFQHHLLDYCGGLWLVSPLLWLLQSFIRWIFSKFWLV